MCYNTHAKGVISLYIREYRSSDITEILRLFYDTVHTVNAADYSAEQLDAWADGKADPAVWDRSLSEHYSLAAIEDGAIVGFGDIDSSGYLDRLYVHKDHQKCGIASAICDKLEASVRTDHITVHASITAKPFFEKRGYREAKAQEVERKGILLRNYVMIKKM